jgi:hypothetical protein
MLSLASEDGIVACNFFILGRGPHEVPKFTGSGCRCALEPSSAALNTSPRLVDQRHKSDSGVRHETTVEEMKRSKTQSPFVATCLCARNGRVIESTLVGVCVCLSYVD